MCKNPPFNHLDEEIGTYVKDNEAGGQTYFGISCGIDAVLFDTCICSAIEFKSIIQHLPEEYQMVIREVVKEKENQK